MPEGNENENQLQEDKDLEVVVDETPVKDTSQEPALEVDLDEDKKKQDKPARDDSQKPSYLSKKEWDLEREKNRHYQNRQLENFKQQISREIQQALEGLKQPGQQAAQDQLADGDQDELDRIAQKDWKEAVKRLAKEQADELYKTYIKKNQEQETQQLRSQIVERSKSFVLSQYPQLADDSSDEAKVFTQVWNENPSLWQNPEGYRLAMYEMEERMRSIGRTPKRVKQEVDKEVRRQMRANISNTAGHGSPASSNKVVLTREQREFCEHNNIPFDVYARQVRADKQVTL